MIISQLFIIRYNSGIYDNIQLASKIKTNYFDRHMDNVELKDYPNVAISTIGEVEGSNYRLEKYSVMARCTNCQRNGYTKVKNTISGIGMAWAICCWLGTMCLCLLVFCIDEFREFRHYCPFCNSMVGAYTPKISTGRFVLLFLLTIGVSIGIGMLIAIGFFFYAVGRIAH